MDAFISQPDVISSIKILSCIDRKSETCARERERGRGGGERDRETEREAFGRTNTAVMRAPPRPRTRSNMSSKCTASQNIKPDSTASGSSALSQ
jgi:hypothetical protein